MGVQTTALTTIGISAATPATFDSTGYVALTYSNIGEVTNFGEYGRTYAEVTHNPVASRGTQKFKGSFNEGNLTLDLAIDKEDTGQALATVALDDDEDYSFEIKYQDGSTDFFQAKVMSFTKSPAGVDSIYSGTLTLAITTNSDGVGIVEVTASSNP